MTLSLGTGITHEDDVGRLGGGSGASRLLDRYLETNGFSFDFTDDTLVVRDTTITGNVWPPALTVAGVSYSAQSWFKRRDFAAYAAPTAKVVRKANGLYDYAPHNMLWMSERFDSPAWTVLSATVVNNAVAAYDGSMTGATFTEAVATSAHNVRNTSSSLITLANYPYTLAVDVKAGTNNYISLTIRGATNHWVSAVFDLSDGLTTPSQTAAGATSGTLISASKTSLGNGWYRLQLTGSHTQAIISHYFNAMPAASGNSINTDGLLSFLGSGRTFHFARPQLNTGLTALPYQTTDEGNLVIRSQSFDTSWTATDNTVSANTANSAGPDAGSTPEQMVEGSAGTALLRSTAFTVPASTVVTASVWLKRRAVLQWIRVMLSDGSDTNGANAWFDIQNGVVGSVAAIGAGTQTAISMIPWGNGWYRCIVTAMCSSSTSLTMAIASAAADASTTPVNAGAYYGFGAQAVLGTVPGKYVATTTAAVYNPYYSLPYEWSSAGVPQGVLIEESRANSATWCRDLTKALWQKVNATAAMTATGVDGIANAASTLTATAANGGVAFHHSAQQQSATSAFIKRRTGSGVVKLFAGADLSTTGSELVTNGTFGTNDLTGWIDEDAGTGTSVASTGAAVLTGDNASNRAAISQALTLVPGKVYYATFTVTATTGTGSFQVGTNALNDSSYRTGISLSAGNWRIYFMAQNATTYIRFRTNAATTDMSVDNVSVKEAVGTDITAQINSSTWTRVSEIGSATTSAHGFLLTLATSGDEVDVDYAQHEPGAFVTSPIYTGGAAITRAVDNISFSIPLMPYSATEGTLYAKGDTSSLAAQRRLLTIHDTTSNDRATLSIAITTGVGSLNIVDGSVAQAAVTVGTFVAGTPSKIAGRWKVNDFQAAAAGVLGTPDTSGTVPTSITVQFGARDSVAEPLNGHVQQGMLLPRIMSDVELQAVSL